MSKEEIEKLKSEINNTVKLLNEIDTHMYTVDFNYATKWCNVTDFAKKIINENNILFYYYGMVFDDNENAVYNIDYIVETLESNNFNDFVQNLEKYSKKLYEFYEKQYSYYIEKKEDIIKKEEKKRREKEIEEERIRVKKEVFRKRVNEEYYDYINVNDIYPSDLKYCIEFENRNPHKYDAYDDFDVVIYIENDIVDYLINIEIVETSSAFGKVVTIVPKDWSNEKYQEIKAKATHVGEIRGHNFYHDGWWEAFPEE